MTSQGDSVQPGGGRTILPAQIMLDFLYLVPVTVTAMNSLMEGLVTALAAGCLRFLINPLIFFHPRGQRLCQSHGDNKFLSLGPGDRRVFRAPGLAAAAIATPFIYNYDGSAGGSVVARPLYRPALAPGGRICPPDSSRFRFIPELPGHPLPGRFTPRRGESRHQSQKVRGWLQPGGPGESVLP